MRTTKLWLRNSSRYSDAEVWPLVKSAYESVERSVGKLQQMPRIVVKLTNCSHAYRGRASWQEWNKDKKAPGYQQRVEWRRILVRIGPAQTFPVNVRYPRFKGDMPEFECRSYREAIVMVAAHEMEHCLGASGRKRGEFRCELSAWDAIEYYRKHQAEVDGEIDRALASEAERETAKGQRDAACKTPEAVIMRKLEAARAMAAKWARKQKLAGNKLRKYQRQVKRLEKQLAEPLPLAATKGGPQ